MIYCRNEQIEEEQKQGCSNPVNYSENISLSKSKAININETIENCKASDSEVKTNNTLDEPTAFNDLCGISNTKLENLSPSNTSALIDSLYPTCSNLTVDATEQDLR